ncbi:MAG: 2-dehydropantoate 2-reductase [Spirochaetaceae bacterium]|jgi:2-dehydropantoate 2-reductase|nr:2-dehydropantoate 2-reductase [Spirochaetaceae bacterium]
MRTALIGAGSLGTIIGACITRGGVQIDLVDSYRPNIDALKEKGATVTGTYNFSIPVSALHIDELSGIYDLFILTTKQTVLRELLPKLKQHMSSDSVILTLQNGIPESFVSEYVGRERTIGGAVGWGATWVSPGVSMLTSSQVAMDKFAFDIGEMDGTITPRIQSAKEILSHVGHVEVITDLMAVRWSKVLMNATFSGMSAALAVTFGEVLNDPVTIQCIAHIADETIRAANATGIHLALMQGKDFEQLRLESKDDIPSKIPFYHDVWDQHVALKASMLQDLEKTRPTEIDFINGIVAKTGREKGIPTPFNDKVIELVKREESTHKLHTLENKSEFLPLF